MGWYQRRVHGHSRFLFDVQSMLRRQTRRKQCQEFINRERREQSKRRRSNSPCCPIGKDREDRRERDACQQKLETFVGKRNEITKVNLVPWIITNSSFSVLNNQLLDLLIINY